MSDRTHRNRLLSATLFSATLVTVAFGQARAYGSALPQLSTIPAGAAEAPELVVGPQESPSLPVAAPAATPLPVVPPAVSAPQTIAQEDEPTVAFVPIAEAGTECFRSMAEYHELWWSTGVEPPAPCFVVYEPNGQDQPDDSDRHYNGESV